MLPDECNITNAGFRPARYLTCLLMSSEKLASLAEVAELLNVPKRTAARYVEREDFPEPIDKLAVGRIWSRFDVVAWGKAVLPLRPGRPPKREK
jgi:hypothetical protein